MKVTAMSPFLFTNTALLLALAALAIPILIHLLLRRKKQRLRFSTTRFFARQDERSSHRRKLRNLLLLATRLLLLALLVLAFARPYLPTAEPGDTSMTRRQVVLIVDRSASMQAGDRWAQAITAARAALAELDANDRVALIDASETASVLSPPAPPARIRSLLDELIPGFGVSDLGEALREATRLLSADGRVHTTLHVISDLQERACETLAAAPVPQGVETRVALIGEPHLPNLAISGLEIESGRAARIRLRS
jgi:Mg-chelatase subunit ChlD